MNTDFPPVCILAGGVGSRLGSLVEEVPKPLLQVAGKPFLVHQVELLRGYGATRFVICTGYLGEQFERVLGYGDDLAVEITYSDDGESPLGTAGAVRRALSVLGERFLVLYGDTYLRIDYRDVVRAFDVTDRPALLAVLHNQSRWDRSNAILRDGVVVAYDKHNPTAEMEWIDYGLAVLTPEALVAAPQSDDLADVYAVLAADGLLAGYEATERFYEIGTLQALTETEEFLERLSSS